MAVTASRDVRLAVAMPSYDGRRSNVMALWHLARQAPLAVPIDARGSALCQVFNNALCAAHELRDRGLATHFLMIHDDITPVQEDWFDRLWLEYLRTRADMISAVSPIKDERGLTSTALDNPNDKYRPRRFTMAEVMHEEVSFTRSNILLNTGLLLFDLRAPWLVNLWFTTDNQVGKTADGRYMSMFEPEDWRWSRDARVRGATLQYATRAVDLIHHGGQAYPNNRVWGQSTDEEAR